MGDLNKPGKKRAQTDTRLYMHHLLSSQNQMDSRLTASTNDVKDDAALRPVRMQSVTDVHGAFFKPQRPRHEDSFVEPRRNYGLPSLSSAERS